MHSYFILLYIISTEDFLLNIPGTAPFVLQALIPLYVGILFESVVLKNKQTRKIKSKQSMYDSEEEEDLFLFLDSLKLTTEIDKY